jgi:hypothetical protein
MEATNSGWTGLPLVDFEISTQFSNASLYPLSRRVGAGEFLPICGSGAGSSLVALSRSAAPFRLTSRGMFHGLLWMAQTVLAALIVYNLVVALAGWRHPAPAPLGTRKHRFRIAIAAHNEEAVIANLVGDLKNLSYQPELFTISVLADRSTDQTAAIARSAGAEVLERAEGPDGKGAVLRWFLEVQPLSAGESLVVVDADNRVPADFL